MITREIIELYKQYLINEEKSGATIEKYIHDVNAFYSWSKGRDIEKSVVIDYKQYLMEIYTSTSVNSYISALNSFFRYIRRDDCKVKMLKIQKQMFINKNKELSRNEYERLLKVAKCNRNERLYYIIQTICSTGIRISELKFITVEAIRCGQANINCKGKHRLVFIPRQLCKKLSEYIKRNRIFKGSIFVSKNGNPLDRSNIWNEMKKLCKKANVLKEKVFPHNLRHPYVKLKLKKLFGLYHSLQSAEILHFPYNLNPFTGIHIHFINEPVSQAL